MAQPTQVLPSNAPPLRDSLALHAHQRAVLQEHSINRQPIYHYTQQPHSLHIQHQRKLNAIHLNNAALGENAYAYRESAIPASYYQAPQVYYPRPAWPRGYQDRDADARQRVAENWQSLYNRFVNCPRYKEYRSRQHKDGKIPQDQKWPEHLEQAFFKALLYWPPMGRRKLMHKDKQRGRNELIADYIHSLTRVQRSRKQVSSHIQVLKPLVDTDARIMQWLSVEDHGHDTGRSSSTYGPAYTSGRLRSTYTAAHLGNVARLPSANEVRQARSDLNIFRPTEFKLFVQPTERENPDDIEPLHVYSQSAPEPLLPDREISDWATFQQEMPVLAERHARQPIECNVIAVESSLALPLACWQEEKIELAVILSCVGERILTAPMIHCNNSFYKNGEPVLKQDRHGSGEQKLTRLEGNAEKKTRCETSLKFGSNFWATTLNPRSTLAKSIMTSAHVDAVESARIRKSVDADVRSITAIQEISMPTQSDTKEPILILHWSFTLSDEEIGTTTWRRLHVPQTLTQTAAIVKAEGAAMAVDTPFDFNAPVECVPASQSAYTAPSLQSPFEYDNGSASAQSPTTWATSISTSGSTHLSQHPSMPNSATEPISAEASFEMSQGSMMMFDPAIGDVLDSAAFDFSVNGGATADCSFAASTVNDQVSDEQAMAYSAATQSWAAPGFAEAYNATDWQDCATQPQSVSMGAYAGYAAPTPSGASEYNQGLDQPQSYNNEIFNSHSANEARQAYAGAMQTTPRDGQRLWPGYGVAGSR